MKKLHLTEEGVLLLIRRQLNNKVAVNFMKLAYIVFSFIREKANQLFLLLDPIQIIWIFIQLCIHSILLRTHNPNCNPKSFATFYSILHLTSKHHLYQSTNFSFSILIFSILNILIWNQLIFIRFLLHHLMTKELNLFYELPNELFLTEGLMFYFDFMSSYLDAARE